MIEKILDREEREKLTITMYKVEFLAQKTQMNDIILFSSIFCSLTKIPHTISRVLEHGSSHSFLTIFITNKSSNEMTWFFTKMSSRFRFLIPNSFHTQPS